MERRMKLAECILIEIESLGTSQDIRQIIALSEQIARDARELALLVKQEIKEVA